MENKVLSKPTDLESKVTHLSVSSCGNFVFSAHLSGHISKINVQSGKERAKSKLCHQGPISGIQTDSLNKYVVTIGSEDFSLKVWDFLTLRLLNSVLLKFTPLLICLNRENNLIALSNNKNQVVIIDLITLRTVREFNLMSKALSTCIRFSNDGQNVLVSMQDSSLKVFNLLSGNLIDWV